MNPRVENRLVFVEFDRSEATVSTTEDRRSIVDARTGEFDRIPPGFFLTLMLVWQWTTTNSSLLFALLDGADDSVQVILVALGFGPVLLVVIDF